MRRRLTFPLLLTLVLLAAARPGFAHDAGCRYCAMTPAFAARSWMEFHRPGEDPVGVCSLHCGAVHMALHTDEPPSLILVTDYLNGGLTDADRAHWVLGGDVPGVMTRRAKWAFRNPADARQFLSDHGGALVTFEEALLAALQDMRTDTLLSQQRRQPAARAATPPDR